VKGSCQALPGNTGMEHNNRDMADSTARAVCSIWPPSSAQISPSRSGPVYGVCCKLTWGHKSRYFDQCAIKGLRGWFGSKV